MTTLACDANKLIEAIGLDNPQTLFEILQFDLKQAIESLSTSCQWRCSVEKVWWTIEAKQLNLTDLYAVRWTYSEEAGINDIEIVLRADEEQDAEDLQEWLEDIASYFAWHLRRHGQNGKLGKESQ